MSNSMHDLGVILQVLLVDQSDLTDWAPKRIIHAIRLQVSKYELTGQRVCSVKVLTQVPEPGVLCFKDLCFRDT